MQLLLAVTLAALSDPLAREPQQGPFATVEAAAGELTLLRDRRADSAFFRRQGAWYVALRDSDGWYTARLPLQDGVSPGRVQSEGPVHQVWFAQHAYGAKIDVDAEWVWPCIAGRCAREAIPIQLQDRSKGTDVEVTSHVVVSPTGRIDVIFTRLKLTGTGAREWRARIEALRGSHAP